MPRQLTRASLVHFCHHCPAAPPCNHGEPLLPITRLPYCVALACVSRLHQLKQQSWCAQVSPRTLLAALALVCGAATAMPKHTAFWQIQGHSLHFSSGARPRRRAGALARHRHPGAVEPAR